MTVLIRAAVRGFTWDLTTADGHRFVGFSANYKAMWERIWQLNGLVIEHES